MTTRDTIIQDAEHMSDGMTTVATQAESSKYEGTQDPELCAALSIIQMNGVADEEHGAVDVAGFFARIDHFILHEDNQGFCNYAEEPSTVEAQATFEKLVSEYPSY